MAVPMKITPRLNKFSLTPPCRAVAYPLGVVGVILAILVIRKILARPADMEEKETEEVYSWWLRTGRPPCPARE